MRDGAGSSIGGTSLAGDAARFRDRAPGADPASGKEDRGRGATGSAPDEDLRAFRRIYGSPEGSGHGGEGAAPLWAGPGMPAATDFPARGPADATLSELASELVGKLLVPSDPDAGGPAGQEVRLFLGHCALEGTEVRIRRGEEGLQVVFLPDSPASGDLIRRKGDSLEGLLRSRLGTEAVRVSVMDGDAPEHGLRGPRG